MLKKTIAILLLILCFTSCTGNMHGEDETSAPATVSEWRGLETIDHNYLDLHYYCLKLELTGSPDPTPPEGYVQPKIDLENIQCKTEQAVYSLSDMSFIYAEVTYVQTEENKDNSVVLHHLSNLERWNGESWDRLIYFGPDMFVNTPPNIILSGETQKECFAPSWFISVVTPGKYRFVAYVDYYPVYAEFEITE